MTKASQKQSWFPIEPLNYLLLALPVAIALELSHADALWIFACACLAIIPLAGLMGRATENLAETLGPGIGGLLNATFGNAAELIIALLALANATANAKPEEAEKMHALVKASITGSIIGNVLLVLGVSICAGGLFHKRQHFNRTAASMGATLLALACIGLLVPTLYYEVYLAAPGMTRDDLANIEVLSEEIAAILAFVYVLSLIFTLRTHQHLFAGPEGETPHDPEWSRRTSLIVLLVATAGVALMSELLVGSVGNAGKALGVNEVFIGVILVAIIGNAAEHSTAVLMAVKNKMDLAVNIAIGSSLQIALFVTPVLVLASVLMGRPLDLHFSLMEIVAMVIAIAAVALISADGETHWMEGVMLLAVYAILGLAFYHLPRAALVRDLHVP